jgi:hypothetical protein
MKKIPITCLAFFITIVSFVACSKGGNTNPGGGGGGSTRTFTCGATTPKFAADVQPILTTVCSINSNCHAAGSTNSGGPFTSYAEVFAKRSNIRAAILAGTMPQTGSISQAQINAFICWIDSGAPNN